LCIQEAVDYFISNPALNIANQTIVPNIDQLMNYITFLINNTYIANGVTNIYRQTIGIPMGTNCGPQLCNLVLYVYESTYVRELYNTNNQSWRLFKIFRRYIDDVNDFENAMPPVEAYHGLQYLETTLPNRSVNYLGATLSVLNGRLDMKIYDKTKDFKLKVLKYPHYNSNTPNHQTSGIVTGQCNSFRLICNSYENFKTAVSDMFLAMLKRGHI
jgi:hypothetical protein